MTPNQIESTARARYNAVGDTFWTSDEIMGYITAACLQMALETHIIQRVFSTSTVASQQEYDWPTNAIQIKRITYAGSKLKQISFKEDDMLTGANQSTTATGDPQYYAVWNEVFYLRPIPASVGTLKVWAVVEPQTVTTSSTLEIPSAFHMALVDYVLREMAAKDENFQAATYYQTQWDRWIVKAKKYVKELNRGDGFTAVQDEEMLPTTVLGSV